MEERIKDIISEILGIQKSDVTDETTMENIPVWDSLMHMSVVEALETEFSTRFSIDEITRMTGYNEIREIIALKGLE